MTHRPTAAELVDVVREALTALAPQVSGAQGYELRVAAKALAIVSAELAQGEALAAAERGRLQAFLDWDEATSLDELRAGLCARLRDGRVRFDDPQLLSMLREGVRGRLVVDGAS